jgi:hypothetical protein
MPGDMIRRRIGNLLLTIGLLCAAVAYNGLVVRAIVLDGDVAQRAAATAMRDERMQRILADKTAEAIERQFLGGASQQLEIAGYDSSDDVRAVAEAVIADPRFADAFGDAIRQVHEFVLVERTAPPVVEATTLLDAARAAAVAQNPAYAGLLPPDATLRVALPTDDLPDLTDASATVADQAQLAAVAAVVLVAGAFGVHSRRPRVVRGVGTWAISVAAVQAALALALPYAAGWLPADVQPVVEAVVTTLRPRLLAPAAMIGAAGAALVIGAWRWNRSLDAAHERYGASAFLAADDEARLNPLFAGGQIETATLRSPMGAPPVPLVSASVDVLPTTPRGA